MPNLSNKVALITGCGSAIGRATAKVFVSHGCRLALSDNDAKSIQEAFDLCKSTVPECDLLIVPGDVTKDEDTVDIVQMTVEHFGHLDILINNAGIFKYNTLVSPMNIFDQIMSINVRSVYRMSQQAIPYLKKTRGCIVNLSNCISKKPQLDSYGMCSAKAAVDQLTRATALEVAPDRVRVNSVNPGYIVTKVLVKGVSIGDQEELFENVKAKEAFGRYGVPEEVAKVISFLASDDASFVTGVNLVVDGGHSLA